MHKRRALSEVISTTILVAAMLVIVTGVMGFALNLFNVQTQEAEFSQAENGVISLAQTVDGILPSPGASGFSSFNSRTGGPILINNYDNMNISIINSSNYIIWNNKVAINMFRYRAGSLVSFENYQWLRAGQFTGLPFITSFPNTLIVQNNSNPLGFVFISHDSGSTWVSMDYRRINVNNLGLFNASLGAVPIGVDQGGNTIYKQIFQEVNMVQLNFVNITGGTFSGSNKLDVVVSNQGISTKSIVIPDPATLSVKTSSLLWSNTSYQVKITVNLLNKLPGQSAPPSSTLLLNIPYGVQVPPTASCLPPGTNHYFCPVNTVINIIVTNIQLSFVGA
ncbi:MAG: hypothetical protein QXX17_04820 [Conexivisphaerales archaeon]